MKFLLLVAQNLLRNLIGKLLLIAYQRTESLLVYPPCLDALRIFGWISVTITGSCCSCADV